MAKPVETRVASGTIVQFVLPFGPSQGQQRPAILVDHSPPEATAHLWVFGIPASDGPQFLTPVYFAFATHDPAGKQLRSWS
jgi:hypothetical protein